MVEITRCNGCGNEFYTRDQSLTASCAAHPEGAPGGPWEYRETGDGKWVVFDSFPVSHERVPRSHDKITALSEASAKMVRDALNRVDRLKGDET
ncbi:hypothetical protein LCGC14_1113680 [marine sediment metagenome]|uniref:Uncharacterized protein n=1 Tax=marine sediment metagenome TaxID=412755 RepID=A0A0F9MAT1_9ZZZZ